MQTKNLKTVKGTEIGSKKYLNTYSINTYVLLHLEHKNDITIIIKLQSATRCSLQKSDNDCDVIFMFKM